MTLVMRRTAPAVLSWPAIAPADLLAHARRNLQDKDRKSKTWTLPVRLAGTK